jgi:hypothetical protein
MDTLGLGPAESINGLCYTVDVSIPHVNRKKSKVPRVSLFAGPEKVQQKRNYNPEQGLDPIVGRLK